MPWPFAALCTYFPITVGKQGRVKAIELKLLNHLIRSPAKFQRWRHKTSRPSSPEITRLGETALNTPSFAKSHFHWDIFTPKWMDATYQKDMLPSLSEWRPHLFKFWATAHQLLSISISRLEICLESRQVLFRGLMTTDLWILRSISIIGGRDITGAAVSSPCQYSLRQSLTAS